MGTTASKEGSDLEERRTPPKKTSSLSSSGRSRSRSIHEGLVRERDKKSEITEYYEIIDEIGQGGLCKVYKIRKRQDKIGGSSREENVRIPRRRFFGTIVPPSPMRNHSKRFSSGNLSFRSKSDEACSSSPSMTQREENFPTSLSYASLRSVGDMYFALKEINLAMVQEDKIDQLRNEVEILKALDHKNIVKAYETFRDKRTKKLMIVMELCTGGDLHSRLPYKEHRAARITRQILSAVSYMHEKNIIHRDIKLENIMFENEHPDAIIKVIDFGLSKEYSQKDNILSERIGTLYSMSPETMLGSYTTQADLWSIGVCTYMLLSNGKQPFEGKTPKQIVGKILLGRYSFEGDHWSEISDQAKDFIRDLLVVKPEDRMTAQTAKQHAWMEKNEINHTSTGSEVDEEFKQRVRECIVQYTKNSEFLKLALNVIAKKSTSEEIFQLRSVFDEFDTENTGSLSLSDFKAALGQFKYSDEDLEEMFRKIDINKNNEINYTEFLAAALETQGTNLIEEHRLAEAFDLLDTDDSGYISRENLRQILGEHSDEKYIDQLISEADFKKDGKISYGEFLQAFKRQKDELVYNIYESEMDGSRRETIRSVESDSSSVEEVLQEFGILEGLRNPSKRGKSR